MAAAKFSAIVDYEDAYVQPLILDALQSQLPSDSCELLPPTTDLSSAAQPPSRLLQFRAYESLDFPLALTSDPAHALINAYVIRKALIRKHYLSATVHAWVTKHPTSPLARHFAPAEDFELDYAEFLDDALIECFSLRASLAANADLPPPTRTWWILKPGMSDRGQGIRLFSTEDELLGIFEAWEADAPDSDDDDSQDDAKDGIVTSHLRHFVAQPYIHPPLLIAAPPFRNRKFHIRTYVVAAGALRVYVYAHMLALFASKPYSPPWESAAGEDQDLLQAMQNIHLTNTCVQSSLSDRAKRESVHLLGSLPLAPEQLKTITGQIHVVCGELFRAALTHPTNFQPLPQSFEIFGVDFLVSESEAAGLTVHLLEVNAFPDFAQTGPDLRDVVVKGLFEEVARVVIGPHFGHLPQAGGDDRDVLLTKVLDVDAGRR